MLITAVSEGWGRSLIAQVLSRGREVLQPIILNISTGPMYIPGGNPVPSVGYPPVRTGCGTPSGDRMEYPHRGMPLAGGNAGRRSSSSLNHSNVVRGTQIISQVSVILLR